MVNKQYKDRIFRMVFNDERSLLELYNAVNQAVNYCIQEGILKEFLSEHRAEVLDMILYDYNEQEHMAMEREEGFADGLEKGVAQGLKDTLKEFLSGLGFLPEQLKEQIENESCVSTLRDWIKLAARAESMEEFILKAGLYAHN